MYLQERRTLAPALTDRIGTTDPRLLRTPRPRSRIRRLTIARHAVVAGDFLRLLKYDEDIQHLPQVQARDLETFVVQASARVGRITMQKVIAIMRSFLRFLAASGKIPVGLDRLLDSPRHLRGERLARALPW
jgi:hypothetical protein